MPAYVQGYQQKMCTVAPSLYCAVEINEVLSRYFPPARPLLLVSLCLQLFLNLADIRAV